MAIRWFASLLRLRAALTLPIDRILVLESLYQNSLANDRAHTCWGHVLLSAVVWFLGYILLKTWSIVIVFLFSYITSLICSYVHVLVQIWKFKNLCFYQAWQHVFLCHLSTCAEGSLGSHSKIKICGVHDAYCCQRTTARFGDSAFYLKHHNSQKIKWLFVCLFVCTGVLKDWTQDFIHAIQAFYQTFHYARDLCVLKVETILKSCSEKLCFFVCSVFCYRILDFSLAAVTNTDTHLPCSSQLWCWWRPSLGS